ncbi:Fasciclin-like arabinogalactan family protein [Rhynchospora pubera]|uniref:Fasciclin-like arabinogalactan family protein n=1 Tax=Rhynchospora pubera TaxID=906938 RepID=A0AAV8FV52_9POAL|nr:Fasciclin-like arabinogalactan family protein [Rhynchospora pubera]
MAISHHASLISSALLFTFLSISNAQPAAPAPGPAGPPNVTAILEKGGQYTSFIRLLKETKLDNQINTQLNYSGNSYTIFAPTDNAFNNLKAGTLNSLSQEEQVNLALYHVLPQYYTSDMFQTVSNPVRTQASGSNGVYTVNITSSMNQVNVSTGIDDATITNTLYATSPLAVYSIEKVLQPEDLFGVKTTAAAPTPASKSPKSTADAPSEAGTASTSANSAVGTKWSSLAGLGLVGVTLGALL